MAKSFYNIQLICGACNNKVILSLLNKEEHEVIAAHDSLDAVVKEEFPKCPGCQNNMKYRFVIKDQNNKVYQLEFFKQFPPPQLDTITT